MMNDIELGSEWALCFEFMTQSYGGEVGLLSNDWKGNQFTYKITHIPSKKLIKAHFRMTDGSIAELIIVGVVRVFFFCVGGSFSGGGGGELF